MYTYARPLATCVHAGYIFSTWTPPSTNLTLTNLFLYLCWWLARWSSIKTSPEGHLSSQSTFSPSSLRLTQALCVLVQHIKPCLIWPEAWITHTGDIRIQAPSVDMTNLKISFEFFHLISSQMIKRTTRIFIQNRCKNLTSMLVFSFLFQLLMFFLVQFLKHDLVSPATKVHRLKEQS
jgi:hypothetical protein